MPRADTLPAMKPLQGRIPPRLRDAIGLIVQDGYSVKKAAETVGYSTHALSAALRRSHVQAYKGDIIASFMANAGDLARNTLVNLMIHSKSDDVRHKAARTILELTGEIGGNADKQGGSGDVVVNILTGPRVNNGSSSDDTEQQSITVEVLRNRTPEPQGPILDVNHTVIGDIDAQ